MCHTLSGVRYTLASKGNPSCWVHFSMRGGRTCPKRGEEGDGSSANCAQLKCPLVLEAAADHVISESSRHLLLGESWCSRKLFAEKIALVGLRDPEN